MKNQGNETSERDGIYESAEWRKSLNNLKEKFINLEGEFKKLSDSISEMKSHINNQSTETDRLSGFIYSLKTDIDTIKREVKGINNITKSSGYSTIPSCGSSQIEKEINGIKADVISLQGSFNNLAKKLTAFEKVVPAPNILASIRNDLANARSDISTNSNAITHIKNALTRLEGEIKAIKECVKTPASRDKEDDIINLIHIALTIPILGMLFLASEKHIGCTIASFVLWGVAAIIIAVYYKIYPHVSEMLDGRLGEIIDYSYMASPIFSLVAFILAIIAVAV